MLEKIKAIKTDSDLNIIKSNIKYAFFGRHESFHLRTGWLKKGWNVVGEDEKSTFFYKNKAIEVLGVGKNMVSAIRYWCYAMDIINETNKAGKITFSRTDFSRFLFENDPYLEDNASLWLLHYKLVSDFRKAPLWSWAFNFFTPREFNKYSMLEVFDLFLHRLSLNKVPSQRTLQNDFLTFIRTYCEKGAENENKKEDIIDSPFSALRLIATLNDRTNFRFRIGPKKDLPAEVVAFSIYEMLENRKGKHLDPGGSWQIDLETLMWGNGSPGMCFKLDGDSLIHYIEEICDSKLLGNASYSTTAGNKQLFIEDNTAIDTEGILENYYRRNR